MSEAYKERMIEAGLEEVLGGQYPPDLSAKILQTLDARRQAARKASNDAGALLDLQPAIAAPPPVQATAEPVPPPVQTASPVQPEPSVSVAADRHVRRRRQAAWFGPMVAASILTLAVLVGLYERHRSAVPQSANQVVHSENQAGDALTINRSEQSPETRPNRRGRPVSQREEPRDPVPSVHVAAVASESQLSFDSPTGTAANERVRGDIPRASSDAEMLAYINDTLRRAWLENSVTPSPSISDEVWCQRVYQRLVGRDPTPAERGRFLRSDDDDRRSTLVDQLLASDQYADRLANLWTDALLEPEYRYDERDLCDQQELVAYLKDSFRNDKGYNKLAYELLTATGSNDAASDNYNPAVNFLLAGSDHASLDDTDRIARALLGKQLVCTRCHSHSASGWEQGDFWELNAFLRQMDVRRDPGSDVAVLSDVDFYGESGTAKDAEIFYKLPNGQIRMAYPTLGEREISHSGLLRDVNRRRELAKLVTGSQDFRRAIVNRVWSWMMEYGFTQPVDDMGPHNPPSHPELLDRLADELAARDFDPDALVRWIVLSEAFGLSDKKMPESWLDNPEIGGRPLFARCYDATRPEDDIYHSLVHTVHSRPTAGDATTHGALARRSSLRPRVGPLEIIALQPDTLQLGPKWLPRLAQSSMSAEQKVEHIFLSVLNRKPTAREMRAAKLVLADRLDDREAIQQIWQTLLTGDRAPSLWAIGSGGDEQQKRPTTISPLSYSHDDSPDQYN